jgi:hypothetical protein
MAIPHSLVAPQGLSSGRASVPRVLLASSLCIFLVVFTCGYYLHAPSLSTSLLLREGVPNDREIEFESSVCLSACCILTPCSLLFPHFCSHLSPGCPAPRSQSHFISRPHPCTHHVRKSVGRAGRCLQRAACRAISFRWSLISISETRPRRAAAGG